MPELLLIDLLIRGGIVTVALATAGFLIACRPREPLSWAILATAATVTVHTVALSQALFPDKPFLLPITGGLTAVALWWAAMELFEVGPWARRVGAPALLAVQLSNCALVLGPGIAWPCAVTGILLFCHVIWVSLATRAGDLVEARRRLRLLIVFFAALEGLVFITVDAILDPALVPQWAYPAKAGGVLALLLLFAAWLISDRDDVVPAPSARRAADPDGRPASALSQKEQAVLARLETAMAEGAWQREGLTIGALAAELGTSEHRLRRVINQGLGHRNFAAFINGYRIRAAQSVLGDPERADRSVLEIAHQVGFASLGPFNRAFRDMVGESPTEFRAHSEEAAP